MIDMKRRFKKALELADTGEVDMGVEDWAQSVGLMRTYGHGEIWEKFTVEEAIEKIEDEVKSLEEMDEEINNEG